MSQCNNPLSSTLHVAIDETGTGGLNDPSQTVFAAGGLAFPEGPQCPVADAQARKLLQGGKRLPRGNARTHAVLRRFFEWLAENDVTAQIVYVRLDEPTVAAQIAAFDSGLPVPMGAVVSGQNYLWSVVTTLCAVLHIYRLTVPRGMSFTDVHVLFHQKTLDCRSKKVRKQAFLSCFGGRIRDVLLRRLCLSANAIRAQPPEVDFGSDAEHPILKLAHLLCTAANHAFTEPADQPVREMLLAAVGEGAVHDATGHFRPSPPHLDA